MKKTLLIIMALAGLFLSASVSEVKAQTYYYYNDYTGKKTPLTLNESKVVVSIPKEYDKTCKRVNSNVKALYTINDGDFDIIIISQSDYEKLTSLDFWEEDAKSVIITPSFFIEDDLYRENGFGTAFSTPYVCIKLKKEEDADLLASYLEQYKLRISWHVPSLPLVYILALTLDSEKSPLEIANEMFESENFASSEPDFAFAGNGAYETDVVRSITTSKTGASSDTYDLQGRRMVEDKPLQRGIYVKDGRKFVVK